MGSGVRPGEAAAREVEALLRLRAVSGLGDRGLVELVRRHGSGEAVARVLEREGRMPAAASGAPGPGAVVEGWARRGIRVLPVTDPGYPPRLLELPDPPPLLFLRGDPGLLEGPAVAVVGSRASTEGGRRVAETVGRVLSRAGVAVVSGMARGIDGAAHRGALGGRGGTVGVLGSGVDRAYPASHRDLFREVRAQGLLLSEFLPGEGVQGHHFPRRNRIIAALAAAVVVVEAGERSGALITVDHALDLGRDVFAFPGSVENPQCRGSNALLRDGARLLTSPEAILEELEGLVAVGERGATTGSPRPSLPGAGLPSELRDGLGSLLEALGPEPRSLEELARRAGVAVARAMAGLTTLELEGWAEPCPGMRFRRAPGAVEA